MANVISGASLAPSLSVAQFVIGQLLDGLKLRVMVDGVECEGVVNNIDFAPGPGGPDYVFAKAGVKMPGKEDKLYVKVSIHRDGTVHVLPNEE